MRLQEILRKQDFLNQVDINTLHNKSGGVFYLSHKCSGGDGIWEKQSVRNERSLK